ncbi:hypothetical protein AVEN_205657-1 [Araneus ventricosus]|uniref:Uncharacterized protein n=1 Tax=Araneus ventricosus TaxID=182803 RepID=A0A4Y2PQV8_ARAVE|nr:hypothetical protein AVEN_205657-1 [Araneus ventricosus]
MRSRKQTERRQLLMESSLACRRGMEGISSKAEGIEEGKLESSKDPWEPRDWDTRTHLKKDERMRQQSEDGLERGSQEKAPVPTKRKLGAAGSSKENTKKPRVLTVNLQWLIFPTCFLKHVIELQLQLLRIPLTNQLIPSQMQVKLVG